MFLKQVGGGVGVLCPNVSSCAASSYSFGGRVGVLCLFHLCLFGETCDVLGLLFKRVNVKQESFQCSGVHSLSVPQCARSVPQLLPPPAPSRAKCVQALPSCSVPLAAAQRSLRANARVA